MKLAIIILLILRFVASLFLFGTKDKTSLETKLILGEESYLNNSNSTSLQELAVHNNEADCWIVFEGEVYDITNYIPSHPGGRSKIVSTCGTSSNFEESFIDQHGQSKVNQLKTKGILIGELA